MTFDPKNKSHKAQLYTALTTAAELTNSYFDDFLQIPFSEPWNLAPGYRRNLLRGDYSAIRAKVLYDFIHDNHFAVGHEIAPEIFPKTPDMRWREILDERANAVGLRIIPLEDDLGVVERHDKRKQQAKHTRLLLGQPFFLEVDCPMEGFAVGLQCYQDTWHIIPLGPEEDIAVPVKKETVTLPLGAHGQSQPLSENSDLGEHEFAVVMLDGSAPPKIVSLADLVRCIEGSNFEIRSAMALVVA